MSTVLRYTSHPGSLALTTRDKHTGCGYLCSLTAYPAASHSKPSRGTTHCSSPASLPAASVACCAAFSCAASRRSLTCASIASPTCAHPLPVVLACRSTDWELLFHTAVQARPYVKSNSSGNPSHTGSQLSRSVHPHSYERAGRPHPSQQPTRPVAAPAALGHARVVSLPHQQPPSLGARCSRVTAAPLPATGVIVSRLNRSLCEIPER